MNNTMDYRNPAMLRSIGIEALTKVLGPVGMAAFLRMYDCGEGDYTKEREQLLEGITLDDILAELPQHA
ncbi:MAG: hypothetical protein LBR73_07115 [Oscillospiraceae bacterium]|jgi:hypothetical protein|nr:hypothetical protein [Oscillospiraceae bacterium]